MVDERRIAVGDEWSDVKHAEERGFCCLMYSILRFGIGFSAFRRHELRKLE